MKTRRGAVCLVHAALIFSAIPVAAGPAADSGSAPGPARGRAARRRRPFPSIRRPRRLRRDLAAACRRRAEPRSEAERHRTGAAFPRTRLPKPKRRTGGSSITPTRFSRENSMIWPCRNMKNILGQYPGAPGRASAYFYLAECYRALNRSAAARTSFQSVLDNYGESEFAGPASYGVAEILFTQKDYAGALPLFHRAAAKSKESALALSARYFEARCLENVDRKDEAQNLYQQVAEVKNPNPYRDDARLAAGTIALARGRKADAFRNYEALANETQKPALKAEATVRAGMVAVDLQQTEKGKFDKAMAEKALSLLQKGRSLPEAGRWRAVAEVGLLRLQYQSGQYDKVLAEYKRGEDEIPEEVRAEMMLIVGNSQRQLGHTKEADEVYRQIIAKYPDREEAKDAQYQRLINFYNTQRPDAPGGDGRIPAIESHARARRPGEAAQGGTFLQGTEVRRRGAHLRGAARLASLAEVARRGRLQTRLVFRAAEGRSRRSSRRSVIS